MDTGQYHALPSFAYILYLPVWVLWQQGQLQFGRKLYLVEYQMCKYDYQTTLNKTYPSPNFETKR